MKYLKFIKKWKIAFAAVFALVAISCLVGVAGGSVLEKAAFAVVYLLIGLAPLLPDLLYLNTPAEKLWKRWASVEGEKADSRKGRAARGELTPVYIDAELKYGLFAGSEKGKYRTTLRGCSCPDFKKRKVPCKHMYYVAEKCGVEKLD